MKSTSINSLRGFACILLVIYHVIGGTPEQGLHITSGFFRKANDVLAYIRMPLFTFLSGYVYSFKPLANYSSTLFLRSKARRLLVPMLTAGTLFAVIQYNIDSSNIKVTNFWMLHILPVAHFWFVESLFIVFCIVVVLEKNGLISNLRDFLFILSLAIVIFFTVLAPAYFGLNGAIYLLPYFLFGLGIGRFEIKYRPLFSVFLSILIFTIVAQLFGQGGIDRQTPIALFIGFSSCYLLVNLNFNTYFLSVIGVSSYSVYLYHVFFSASVRIAITLLTTNMVFHLIIGVLSAIAGPIFLERILSKSRLLNTIFLGKRFIPLTIIDK